MKLLKQTTLAAAIAAATAFTAQAGMVAMDDEAMGNTTGQAGVTIETTTGAAGITIGSVTYTDEGSVHIGTGAAGTIQDANNVDVAIKITGGTYDAATDAWTAEENVTRQLIDVDASGNLITSTENVSQNSKRTQVGSVQLRSSAQQGNNATGATLVNDLDMIQTAGNSKAHILNLSDSANTYAVATGGIMDKSAVIGKMTDAGFTTGGTGTAADGNADAVKMAIVTQGESKIDKLNVSALDGAVTIGNLTYDNGAGGMIASTQVIWAVGGTATASNKAGIWVSGSDSVGTLKIQSVGIGGASIGSVAINNLSQSGKVQRIYGH